MRKIARDILDTIGNTPLVHLSRFFGKEHVYAKLESANPAGSMKDRTSHLIVSELLRNGNVMEGGTIVESSSGNMAVGLAQACRFYGLKLKVVVDVNLNKQTHKLLTTYGADVIMVNEPLPDGGFLAARLKKVNELLDTIPGSIWSNQYGNPNNPKAYFAVMEEITNSLSQNLDYLFVATSTCGSLMGCANYIEQNELNTKLIAVDANGSVLFGGRPEKRKIPGHGASVPSQFLDISKIHDVIHVTDLDCIQGCRDLLNKEAILSGGSSGGIVSAYQRYSQRLPEKSTSVLLLPDSGERYLDTVYNDNWVKHIIGNRNFKRDNYQPIKLQNGILGTAI
ncbi:2,3-diaminopropionate biosynthesis protein SbnA [Zobellia sp. 1_MG-2023]|uniref:2,3-diaminopropionate biosynthesis protein SbnA n=1 Tax=Zobellia sp. 1_MG-2023 TaxID=3062626 RepID=UPI0026E27D32|nr:2,3-diaminopropionate biosynthesis protein SbnA [Zobellia sp. 1_MG-2023]MDO6821319.1 2,3-diaminopropionate biosynthesis protein SbnA [Zobellia sp. 1_MG-2023]